MNIQSAKQSIAFYMKADIPCFMWGAPGVGKSDAVRQIAKDNGDLPVIDFRAILRDPVDIRGLPAIDHANKIAQWLPPSDLPNELRHGPEGILFLDELNAAPQAVQAACFGLVLDRKVGEYALPNGWRIIAAGNRASDRAAAQRMPTALANRFAHIDIEPDVDEWSKWATRCGMHPMIVAFIRFRPTLLHKMDTAADVRSFPTPRSWTSVAKLMALSPDEDMRFHLVSGLVGQGAATEFEGFVRIYQNLPSLDAVLSAPDRAPVPDDAGSRYAISAGLARKITGKNMVNALRYLVRLPKEFEIMTMVDVITDNPKLTHTSTFVEWASKNKDVVL